jgi:hypothetical protein
LEGLCLSRVDLMSKARNEKRKNVASNVATFSPSIPDFEIIFISFEIITYIGSFPLEFSCDHFSLKDQAATGPISLISTSASTSGNPSHHHNEPIAPKWRKKVHTFPSIFTVPLQTKLIDSASQIPHNRRTSCLYGPDRILQDPHTTTYTPAIEHAEIRSCRYVLEVLPYL